MMQGDAWSERHNRSKTRSTDSCFKSMGALASMPEILANVRGATLDHGTASRILGDLNFQTAAFRDLLVVLEDGSVWASARKGRTNGTVGRALAQARHKLASGAATVVGPLRNQVTGDWSIYLARAVTLPTVGSSLAAAEIPVPLLVRLLSREHGRARDQGPGPTGRRSTPRQRAGGRTSHRAAARSRSGYG